MKLAIQSQVRLQRHPRLLSALAIAMVICAVSGWIAIRQPSGWIAFPTPLLLGFDGGSLVFLLAIGLMIRRATIADMSHRAAVEDEDRNTVLVLSAIVATAILLTILFELHGVKDLPPEQGRFHVALSAGTILLSWFFMNTMFALHYAHEYYGDADPTPDYQPRRGILFPGHRDPDYWDFLYLAFVIGMTFQVSDMQVEDHGFRQLVLVHSVLAFLFSVIILGVTINIIAGLV
jgi:uncharacterized membrane protein